MKDLDRYIDITKKQQIVCPAEVEARVFQRISEKATELNWLPSFVSLKGAFVAAVVLFAITGSFVSFMSLSHSSSSDFVQVSKDLGFDSLQKTELVSLY
jgi:hypothetical protein